MQTTLPRGIRVDAYKNLNADCLSILSREYGSDDYGTVIGYSDSVVLRDATFVVGEDSRDRVRREGKKNVHAYVRGTVTSAELPPTTTAADITYNPYEYDWFVTRADERAVESARMAEVTMDGVRATGVAYKFDE